MARSIEWQIQHASVVLVAESPIEATSIAPDSLKSKGVIPQDWTVTSQISIQVFAQTEFVNGVQIRIEGNRCIFQQDINGDLPNDYMIIQPAINYAEATELGVNYQAVGINWQLSGQPVNQNRQPLRELLGLDMDIAGFKPESVRLVKPLGDKTCNLSFTESHDEVSAAVNYHHPLSGQGAVEAIADWQQRHQHLQQEIITGVLSRSGA